MNSKGVQDGAVREGLPGEVAVKSSMKKNQGRGHSWQSSMGGGSESEKSFMSSWWLERRRWKVGKVNRGQIL